jgi:hypothetical protein
MKSLAPVNGAKICVKAAARSASMSIKTMIEICGTRTTEWWRPKRFDLFSALMIVAPAGELDAARRLPSITPKHLQEFRTEG